MSLDLTAIRNRAALARSIAHEPTHATKGKS